MRWLGIVVLTWALPGLALAGTISGSLNGSDSGATAHAWILSAPPRGSRQQETALYAPIAHFLQSVSGHAVKYKYPGSWLNYSREMAAGKYDLVFDGPHFVGWRDHHLGDTPLVRLPAPLAFAVVERAGERFTKLSQLIGRPVCANSPPYLGTLMLLNKFKNPDQQPVLVIIHGWLVAYKDLMAKQCVATVLLVPNLHKLEHGVHATHILYRFRVYPNQAISASPRIPPAIQARMRQALLSPRGRTVTRALRKIFVSKPFVAASAAEYKGIGELLNNTLYFGYN
ncbi:MAG: phosphate/phosphite/phosphonate ABC transporter substrate-binding protein [Acidiferrobacter sp.]